MLLKKITYLIFALLPLLSVAQKKDTAPLDLEDYILVKTGDTLTINLDELTILPKLNFNSPTATYIRTLSIFIFSNVELGIE